MRFLFGACVVALVVEDQECSESALLAPEEDELRCCCRSSAEAGFVDSVEMRCTRSTQHSDRARKCEADFASTLALAFLARYVAGLHPPPRNLHLCVAEGDVPKRGGTTTTLLDWVINVYSPVHREEDIAAQKSKISTRA